MYPEDTGYVFVDWLDNHQIWVRDPHPPILWLGALGVIIAFELFIPEYFWVKLLFYVTETASD